MDTVVRCVQSHHVQVPLTPCILEVAEKWLQKVTSVSSVIGSFLGTELTPLG